MRPATLLTLAAAVALAAPSQAQRPTDPGPDLGDTFIFFAEGVNVEVQNFEGDIVTDVPGAEGRVMAFPYRDFGEYAVAFNERVGRDASENLADGDVLNVRLWSSPDNAGKTTSRTADYSSVQIRLMDSFEPTAPGDLDANAPAKDFGFRLTWVIPEEYHDGTWRNVSIPLPPATIAELNANRAQYQADGDLRQYWYYEGAKVADGGVGVGPGFGGSADDERFQEFDFENLAGMYVVFENNTGGGPVYLDNVYLGDAGADLTAASAAPAAVTGVSIETEGASNEVTIDLDGQYGRYNVYGSDSPITDVTADGVYLIDTVEAEQIDSGDAAAVITQEVYVPFPSYRPVTTYYAVTGDSRFGVPNRTVSAANSGQVTNDGELQGYIYEFTAARATEVFDEIDEGTIDLGSWGVEALGVPAFALSQAAGRSKTTNNYATPRADDADLSGKLWMAYDDDGFLYYFAEVRDDQVFPAAADETARLQNRESVEVTLGLYAQSSLVFGTDFRGSPLRRGDTPDFQFRFTPRADANGNPANVYNWVRLGPAAAGPGAKAIPNSIGAWEYVVENGQRVGYRMTGAFDLADVYDSSDTPFAFPGNDDVAAVPFGYYLNDRDTATGDRDHQVSWVTKFNTGSGFFNESAQWGTAAIVGQDRITRVTVSSEGGPVETTAFSLGAVSPNPTTGRAAIDFDLAAPAEVTLEVFDALGRRVAVLADGASMAAGPHEVEFSAAGLAPGVYVYRLRAGGQVAARSMTVVR